jgi:hypothetical protein
VAEEHRRAAAVSPEGKRNTFFVAAMATLALGAFGVVTLITGEWQWVAAGVMAMLAAAVLAGVIIGVYALAERLFPDR